MMNKSATTILLLAGVACFAACSSGTNPAVFLDHQNAGDAASSKGNYFEAEQQYRAALAEAEKSGAETEWVKKALHSLGSNLESQKRYAEAETDYQREFAVAKKVHGEGSPDLLLALSDLTMLYINQERFAEAEKYNQIALSIVAKLPEGERKESAQLAEYLRDWIKNGRP